MFVVKDSQKKKLDDIYLDSYIKSFILKYDKEENKHLVTYDNVRNWVVDAKKYSIIIAKDVDYFINMCVDNEEFRQIPRIKWIEYYLTHPDMKPMEKLGTILKKLNYGQ